MPTVYLPTSLRQIGVSQPLVNVSSGSVRDILAELGQRYPGIKSKILDDSGAVKRYVNIFLNGRDIRSLSGDATEVRENDEVYIVPAMAGG